MPGIPARRWRWALGASLAIAALLGLLVGLLAWRPAVLLRAGLWLADQEQVAFDEFRLDLDGLEVTGLRIGETPGERLSGHRVGRLTIDYRPGDLLRGRIGQVSIEDVTVRGRVDREGFRLIGAASEAPTTENPPALPPLPMPERILLRDVRIELATPLGRLMVPLQATLRVAQDRAVFELSTEAAELAGTAGTLLIDLQLEGQIPLDAPSLARGATASGRAALRAEALSVPGIAHGIGGPGGLAFDYDRGRLDVTLSELRLQVAGLAAEWEMIAAVLPAPWRIELARPVGIAASFGDGGTLVEGRGDIALAAAGPQLKAAFSAAADLAQDGRLRELVVPEAEIELGGARWAGLRLDHGSIIAQGAGAPAAWQGTLDLTLAGAGAPWPGLTVDGATARAGLDVSFADGRFSATAREPGKLQAAAVSWADGLRLEGLEVGLQPSAGPLLSAELGEDAVAWQQRATFSLSVADVAAGGAAPLRLSAAAERLQVELSGDQQGLATGAVTLSGGAVHMPAYHLRLSGIATEARLAPGPAHQQPVLVTVATIAHDGAPPWFAPLRLDGSLQPEGSRIAFEVKASRPVGAADLRVRGEHDLAAGEGHAQIDLSPVAFAPGQLQPAELSPLLGDFVEEVSGRLALGGVLAWDGGGDLRTALDVLVDEIAFTAGPARFEQVNGVIALDQLAPPSTPPGQQLAVGLIDIGLPLTNGLLTFDLEPEQLIVEQLRWRFAEGRIRATPFTLGSERMMFATTLSAERLQLDEIFALAQLDGLSGKGTMHGTLPITVTGTEAVIEGGQLVSDAPGWVRYRPGQTPAALQAGGENVNLLLQALENFHYEELRLTIDGRTDGEMDVGLHIAGANPDLYDGYPIEFNLNLEGALAEILRAGLAGYQIPERIREQMRGFGR